MHSYLLKLQTLSPLILSPRSSQAFYRDALLDESDIAYFSTGEVDDEGKDKTYNIIYPFYRYGEYTCLDPEMAQQYIPGSSIKGALTVGRSAASEPLSLMVDDVTDIEAAKFTFISPLKSQYFNDLPQKIEWTEIMKEQQAKGGQTTDGISIPQLLRFFAGTVGIEALHAGVDFDVIVRYKDDINGLLEKAHLATKEKLSHYLRQLSDYIERIDTLKAQYGENRPEKERCDESIASLETIIDFTNAQLNGMDGKGLLFLGGYKGLVRSITADTVPEQSAIFVDEMYRPFGYIKILEARPLT